MFLRVKTAGTGLVMRYLHKVESLNRRDMRRFIPLAAGGVQYGWLTEERAAAVLAFGVWQYRGQWHVDLRATPVAGHLTQGEKK